MTPRNPLHHWMRAATQEERERLAEITGTSVDTLRQFAGAYRTGGELSLSAETASKLERGIDFLKRDGLPQVLRTDMCRACALCEYAQAQLAKE